MVPECHNFLISEWGSIIFCTIGMGAFYGTTHFTQTLISCISQYIIYYFHRLDFQIFLPPALIMDGMEIVFLLICCPHVILIQDPKKASLDLVLKSHRRPFPNKHDHKTLWVTTVVCILVWMKSFLRFWRNHIVEINGTSYEQQNWFSFSKWPI